MIKRLKLLRANLELSQAEIAKKLSISQSTYAHFETGNTPLKDRHIKLICSTFNVNERWLRTGEGEMFITLNNDDEFDMLVGSLYAENDEFKKKVIKAMLSLEDEDWMFIKKFIDKM